MQLPQGPDFDSYKIYLSVYVIDDTGGVTIYSLPNTVIVMPNLNVASDLTASISSNDPNSPTLLELNSGNVNLVSKNVIGLTTVFNLQANPASSNQIDSSIVQSQNNQLADLREFLVNKIDSLTISDASSIKTIASSLAALTGKPTQVTSNTAVI